MTEPRGERSSVRYYCTAGNGMEPFLVQEVKTKLAAENVCQIPGKVLFSCSAGIHRVRELKAAERLFLLLRRDSPVTLPTHSGPAKAASVLQSRLLGDRSEWTSAVMTWSRLQRELAGRRTTACTPSTALGPTRKRTNREEEEEERGIEREEEEESGNGRQQRSNGQNETQTSEKKRKGEEEENRVERERGMERRREEERSRETRGDGESGTQRKRKRDDDDEEEEDERRDAVWESSREKQNGERGETSERERKREEEEEDEEEERGAVAEIRGHGPGQDHNAERNCSKTGDADKVEHGIEVETAAGGDGTLREPGGDKPELSPPVPIVSFRISCKCTGALSRRFSTQELSRVIGAGLSRLLGWKADLKNPQLEVNVYLSDDHCLIGMPLTRLPLANRSYIQTTGLRSTVAWALGSLAQIQPGSCVVDPMCGVGTILIEAAQEHKDACFLGMDIDDRQLQRANENVAFGDLRNRIHLLKASSIELPLPSASVDAVVSDLPFGRKFGTKTHMAANLPLILTEMERVLRVGGILVLLLSPQLSCLLKKLLTHPGTGPTPPQDTEPQAGLPSHPGIKPTSTQETEPRTGLQRGLPPPLSSLKHQATHRVSLGAIDGLIHKYVKTET
ncbi:THUMP domain-containing protein 2 [Centroberyx affinis]|uniref:THUMP domain-containing protein 2 n=1 Tax=Centroberyx affinis TaxID=166261 RepID=UPI003A5C404D